MNTQIDISYSMSSKSLVHFELPDAHRSKVPEIVPYQVLTLTIDKQAQQS